MKNIEIKIFSFVIFYTFFINCNNINMKPIINLTDSVNNLEVNLIGSLEDEDGEVVKLEINWGDNLYTNKTDIDFSNILESHTYTEKGSYNIEIKAIDNLGDTTMKLINVTTNYPVADLSGIKETMYKKSENEILILTLNLHTFQETNQEAKLYLIADLIAKMDVDFVAFQECAQNTSSEIVDGILKKDNMALLISNIIKEKYSVDYKFVWNWAHYGWNVWEEGVSVLSKHQIIDTDNRYISTSNTTSSIDSRKVIYAACNLPNFGQINIFSAHTHWRKSESDQEQNNQIKNIKAMVVEKENLNPATNQISIVCGDFNGDPTSSSPWSEGYFTMIGNNEFKDSFLEIYPTANQIPRQNTFNTIFGSNPGRIDYIFIKNSTNFTVLDAQIIFTKNIIGMVSDHYGVITKIKMN